LLQISFKNELSQLSRSPKGNAQAAKTTTLLVLFSCTLRHTHIHTYTHSLTCACASLKRVDSVSQVSHSLRHTHTHIHTYTHSLTCACASLKRVESESQVSHSLKTSPRRGEDVPIKCLAAAGIKVRPLQGAKGG
jgi:hypothetical protein